ncbi:hypothetical protein K0B96_09820 [Horticoccus luteus]|uniref:Uncharacterized protein n=1 Tax=Horticoccus luteus TaxID=2862869 RepID=A0A8F9TSS4_9BACT|nr:hypothetical protein [Horticoccus luteus]QYM77623.1 hypothetical protein K0B96_09820 [Horticoccus luteus]
MTAGCAKRDENGVTRLDARPLWIAYNDNIIDEAMRARSASEAVSLLENGKGVLESRLARHDDDDRIAIAIMVDTMHLAAAHYASGKVDLALDEINKIAESRSRKVRDDARLIEERKKILEWIVNAIELADPPWGARVKVDFSKHISGEVDLWSRKQG